MNTRRLFLLLCLVTLPARSGVAASFDCAKAKAPIERLICSNPELDAADTKMGELFKRVNKSFPVKGFVLHTQKSFISGLPYCLKDLQGKPLDAKAAAPKCLEEINSRIAELERYEQSRIYGNSTNTFDPESIIIFVHEKGGKTHLSSWGNWMPNAYDPKPFPDGYLCAYDAELIPGPGGYKIDGEDDALITITDGKISFSSYVVCTARTGGFNGDYPRITAP